VTIAPKASKIVKAQKYHYSRLSVRYDPFHFRTDNFMRGKVTLKASRFLYGKHVIAIAAIVAGFGFFASPASASCSGTGTLTCTDTTKVEAYNGTSFASTYTGNGFIAGVGDVLQSAGDPFDTDKLIATLSDHRGVTTLELKYYTSFNGNEVGAHYADIFLGNNAASPNTFGYAIALGNQQTNGGLSTSGFYSVTSSTEMTSEQIWSSKSGTYGGKFQGTDGAWRYSPTVVASNATNQPGFTTSVVETTTAADPGYGYLVDVKLVANNTDFAALFGGGLSIFWGTADCSNDAIQAVLAFNPVHVPEPVTLSLFGAGVIGAFAIRRRRKPQAS
jgi:hypothetical protein